MQYLTLLCGRERRSTEESDEHHDDEDDLPEGEDVALHERPHAPDDA